MDAVDRLLRDLSDLSDQIHTAGLLGYNIHKELERIMVEFTMDHYKESAKN